MKRAFSSSLPIILALLPAAVALAIYLPTWSPAATWAHFGDDGPELEAAGRVLGVPHPTGYPLLMLLIRAVGLLTPLPWSALNLVTLLAAVAAVAAAGLAGREVAVKTRLPRAASLVAGALGAIYLATSLTWWKQAVIGEVYTLHLALLAAALALVFRGGRRAGLLAAYLLGLGMAHHLQTLPVLAVVLVYLALTRRLRPSLAHVALFLLPLSLYLVLLIRSRLDPPFDWGNPETLGNLWWMVSGTPYRGNLFREGLEPFLQRWTHALAAGPVAQLGWTGAGLAASGFIVALRSAPREAVTLALLYLGTTFIAAAYAIPDPAAYYLPAILALALMAGVGSAALVTFAVQARQRLAGHASSLAPVAAVAALLAASFASRIVTVGREADASHDRTGYDYARDGIEAVESSALVVSHGDGRTFSLWYGAEILSPRTDVAILYDNLLDWPWYRAQVADRHPDLSLPPDGMSRPMRHALLIEAHLDQRPVYVTELQPELAHLFDAEPAGPLFRVTRRPDREPGRSTIAEPAD
jgi:hypothetical protein